MPVTIIGIDNVFTYYHSFLLFLVLLVDALRMMKSGLTATEGIAEIEANMHMKLTVQ